MEHTGDDIWKSYRQRMDNTWTTYKKTDGTPRGAYGTSMYMHVCLCIFSRYIHVCLCIYFITRAGPVQTSTD